MADRRRGYINVSVDDADAAAILAELAGMPDKVRKAKFAAAKKTMRTAEARLARGFTEQVNLKSKDVKEKIVVRKHPSSQAPTGVLRIKATRFPLWKFNRSLAEAGQFFSQKGVPVKKRKPKTGAGWKIFKGESKTRHKGFFIARETKSGQIQIMRRRIDAKGGKAAKPGRDYRTAYGISLIEADRRRRVLDKPIGEIREVMLDNLRSQVDRFLKRKKNAR